MPLIEGFRVQNYRSLQDVTLGRSSGHPEADVLTPLTVAIGKNDAGKSTLFDAFGFLADCLAIGVEAACDREQRGGFQRLRSMGIEEPENGLYHKLLDALAREFRAHATGRRNAPQIFVTTHQPYFVDALTPAEVWILEKGPEGFSRIRRVSELEIVRNMVAEGLPLGGLWYSDYLDSR